MNLDYNIPTRWSDLTERQLRKFAPVFFEATANQDSLIRLVDALFLPTGRLFEYIKYRMLKRSVSITELLPYLDFIKDQPAVYHFPDIKGLKKPTPRLGSLIVEQFSVSDQLFWDWRQSKSEIHLRRLVASLYVFDEFHKSALVEVANITDRQKPEVWARIALAYMSCRLHIADQFPRIFPKPVEQDPDVIVPVFKKSEQNYTPFHEVIIAMAMDDPQPLGDYSTAKRTNLYEFLNVFTKSLERAEKTQNG